MTSYEVLPRTCGEQLKGTAYRVTAEEPEGFGRQISLDEHLGDLTLHGRLYYPGVPGVRWTRRRVSLAACQKHTSAGARLLYWIRPYASVRYASPFL
jgi:hypothetical protein